MSTDLMVVSQKANEQMGKWLPDLQIVAPKGCDMEVWKRSVVLAIAENKNLAKCLNTQTGQVSLYHSLKLAASTGLSLNPLEGKAALIPYGEKIGYQVMKNGMIDVALRDPKVQNIRSLVVRENDEFTIKQTLDGDTFEFVPDNTDRGNPIGYFAALKMKSGPSYVLYMTVAQVTEHKNRYSKAANIGAWKDSFDGMAEKTVIKALLRTNNISPELDRLVAADDKAESEMVDVTPKPSLEDSVVVEPEPEIVDGEIIIEPESVETVEEVAEEAPDLDASGILAPTEKGDITEAQVKKVWAMLHGMGLENETAKRMKVSQILGYSDVIASFNNLTKALAKIVFDVLDAEIKENA